MNRKEIKAAARKSLGGNVFANSWLLVLLAALIVAAIASAASVAAGVGTLIVAGPLTFGFNRGLVKLARRETESFKLESLIDGFKESFGNSFLAFLLEEIYICLWSLLLIIPGIVKSYSYAMTFYILQDNPSMGGNEAITKSRQMMKGHKWELFVLDLSFIGWYIVGALCFGVGTLWVDAYHNMARAHFYEAIRD